MCFTRLSRCDIKITPCFTIRRPVRTSKGTPKGAQKGPRTQNCPKRVPRPPRANDRQTFWRPRGTKKEPFRGSESNQKSCWIQKLKKLSTMTPQGSPRGSSGPQKSKKSFGWGCNFQLFELFSRKALWDRFWSSRRFILGAFWN